VLITSQNHGFAIDEHSLPQEVEITHRSLFDGTLQGFQHKQLPIFSFQGHPEASPGPEDVTPLFQKFSDYMKKYQDMRHKKINKEAPHVETN
jgi:carbamoyl-phosphate synthase small subunit